MSPCDNDRSKLSKADSWLESILPWSDADCHSGECDMGSTVEYEVLADTSLGTPYAACTECCDDGSEANVPLLEEFEEEFYS